VDELPPRTCAPPRLPHREKKFVLEAPQLRQTPKFSLHCAGRKASEPRKPGFPTIEIN
jgi:hypothetical protein